MGDRSSAICIGRLQTCAPAQHPRVDRYGGGIARPFGMTIGSCRGSPERHWLPCSLSASALREHPGRRYRFVPPAPVVAGRGLMLRACYLAAAAVAVGNVERGGLGSEVPRTRDRIAGRRRAVRLLPGADLGFGAGGCRGGRVRDLRATRFLPRAPCAGAGFCARRPRGDCGLVTTPGSECASGQVHRCAAASASSVGISSGVGSSFQLSASAIVVPWGRRRAR